MTALQKWSIGIGLLALVLIPIALYLPQRATAPEEASETILQNDTPQDWATYQDDILSFSYPETLSTTYIHATEWPPKVTVSDGSFSCDEKGSEVGGTRRIEMDGAVYCATTIGEGAAGSVYVEHTYTTEREDKLLTLMFTLRMTQCANYDTQQMQECTAERESFNADMFADSILRTMEITSR